MSSPARRVRDTAPAHAAPEESELGALEEVSAAVEAGAGLPEVVRAAARALDASLLLSDPGGAVLAVAARSKADEGSLNAGGAGVQTIELRLRDELVGRLRMRPRSGTPSPALLSVLRPLLAGEADRSRAPGRASEQAAATFLHELLEREPADRGALVARGRDLGIDVGRGGSVIAARAHPLAPADEDWRSRMLTVSERGARAAVADAITALVDRSDARAAEVLVLVPDPDEALARRAVESVLRELEANLRGFTFAVGRSRAAGDPQKLHRAAHEALLAATVAESDPDHDVLDFAGLGAYLLLLSVMIDDPTEIQRFYADTVEPLVAYDEQYETGLVPTLETFLECDGNVAQTAQRMYTHRHTIRYRLERVRELAGLDVGSSEGREKLSLGLKAMRVLGIATPRGPATETGAEAGRVPGRQMR
ncbi:MAG: PucR family transcriptional regulator [Solirubrobacteraceae bacterium]